MSYSIKIPKLISISLSTISFTACSDLERELLGLPIHHLGDLALSYLSRCLWIFLSVSWSNPPPTKLPWRPPDVLDSFKQLSQARDQNQVDAATDSVQNILSDVVQSILMPLSPVFCTEPLSVIRREVLPPGILPCQLSSTVLFFKTEFTALCLCISGLHLIYLHTASVIKPFPFHMLLSCPSGVIMMYVI